VSFYFILIVSFSFEVTFDNRLYICIEVESRVGT